MSLASEGVLTERKGWQRTTNCLFSTCFLVMVGATARLSLLLEGCFADSQGALLLVWGRKWGIPGEDRQQFGPFAERKCLSSKTAAPVVVEKRFVLQSVPGLFSTPSILLGILELEAILIHACERFAHLKITLLLWNNCTVHARMQANYQLHIS